MKRIALTTALVLLSTGFATARPQSHGDNGYNNVKPKHATHGYIAKNSNHAKRNSSGRITPRERIAITKSRLQLAALKRKFLADGRLSLREKFHLRFAEMRHKALVRKERRG